MNDKGRALIALGLVALPLALLAQAAFDRRFAAAGLLFGALAIALAGIAYSLGFGKAQPTAEYSVSAWPKTEPLRERWLLLGANLAGVAFFTLGSNQFTFLGTLAWIGAIISVVWMATPPKGASDKRSMPAPPTTRLRSPNAKNIAAVVAVTLLAAFFRFYRLDSLPAEMGLDPPYIYLGSQEILTGDRPIFVTLFPGQESGFFYLVATVSRFLGLSFFTLKAASALIGTLTVSALLLLGRRLFSETVAIAAAVLLAVNRWHVLMSRTGLRPVLMPVVVVALLWTLARALRYGQLRDFAYVGLVLGLGAFTYTGTLFLPLIAVFAVALYGVLLIRVDLNRIAARLGLTLLVMIVVVTPLLRYAMTPDNAYLSRFERRVRGQGQLETAVEQKALDNAARVVAAFNWHGDNVYAFNLPQKRQMGWVSGSLFLLGFIYALIQIRRGPYLLLLLTLLVTLLPTFITFSHPQEVPNAGRLIGAVVPACLLAALPINLLHHSTRKLAPRSFSVLSLIVVIALLAVETYESYRDVFFEFEKVQPHHNMAVSAAIAELVDGFTTHQSGTVYVVYRPNAHRGFDFQAVEILSQNVEPGWSGFVPAPQLPSLIPVVGSGPTMFVVHPDDITSMPELEAAFPTGRVDEVYDPAGVVGLRTFTLNEIP